MQLASPQKHPKAMKGFSKLEWDKRGIRLAQPNCPHSSTIADLGARVCVYQEADENCQGRAEEPSSVSTAWSCGHASCRAQQDKDTQR